jgi:hypothetical protein
MPTTEIPKSEWSLFFDSFSLRHEGWLVDLDIDEQDISHDKLEVHDLPLVGISADEKDDENIISISVGKTSPDLLRHQIVDPTSVRLTQTDDGADKAIEITSGIGRTVLALRIPAHIDTLDGYVA